MRGVKGVKYIFCVFPPVAPAFFVIQKQRNDRYECGWLVIKRYLSQYTFKQSVLPEKVHKGYRQNSLITVVGLEIISDGHAPSDSYEAADIDQYRIEL